VCATEVTAVHQPAAAAMTITFKVAGRTVSNSDDDPHNPEI